MPAKKTNKTNKANKVNKDQELWSKFDLILLANQIARNIEKTNGPLSEQENKSVIEALRMIDEKEVDFDKVKSELLSSLKKQFMEDTNISNTLREKV